CFFFSSRRRHTRCLSDWSSDVCSSDLWLFERNDRPRAVRFSNRLWALLAEHDPTCEAVLGAACRALIAEAAGDYWTAIRARERRSEERRVGKGGSARGSAGGDRHRRRS